MRSLSVQQLWTVPPLQNGPNHLGFLKTRGAVHHSPCCKCGPFTACSLPFLCLFTAFPWPFTAVPWPSHHLVVRCDAGGGAGAAPASAAPGQVRSRHLISPLSSLPSFLISPLSSHLSSYLPPHLSSLLFPPPSSLLSLLFPPLSSPTLLSLLSSLLSPRSSHPAARDAQQHGATHGLSETARTQKRLSSNGSKVTPLRACPDRPAAAAGRSSVAVCDRPVAHAANIDCPPGKTAGITSEFCHCASLIAKMARITPPIGLPFISEAPPFLSLAVLLANPGRGALEQHRARPPARMAARVAARGGETRQRYLCASTQPKRWRARCSGRGCIISLVPRGREDGGSRLATGTAAPQGKAGFLALKQCLSFL